MSEFTKSVLYSGVVLVAGLIAIFAISSNMTQPVGPTGMAGTFSAIEPAAGQDSFTAPAAQETTNAADMFSDQAPWESDEALAKLRKALQDAGVDIENIEPAAGDDSMTAHH